MELNLCIYVCVCVSILFLIKKVSRGAAKKLSNITYFIMIKYYRRGMLHALKNTYI